MRAAPRAALLSSLCTLLPFAPRATAECLPLAPRNPEGNYIVPGVLGDIVYRRVGDRELALDAFVQRGDSRRPLAVVVHGGGWTAGSRVSFVGQLLEMLSEGGFNWVSIDYRLGPASDHGKALEDVVEALAFVRCHAEALRADPSRFVLLGEDAGADLAALASARRPPGLAAVVLVGGVYEPRAILDSSLSISRMGGRGSVPTLVVHGSDDSDVPLRQAASPCEALRSSGGACDLVPVEGASHRAENWWPSQWGYKRRIVEWLAARVGHPGPHEEVPTRLRKRVVFDTKAGLYLDAWTPEGRGPFPAVILVHGGGWEAGDRVTYITPLFEPLARAGFAWFSIDYRLTPRVSHPAQLDDLRSAIAWVRRSAHDLRVDTARLALIGESASGQMVMQVATEDEDLLGVVSFYGVYDIAPLVTDASPRSLLTRLFGRTVLDDDARAEMRRFSPIHHVRVGMPPVLLIHGTSERLFEQGVAMERVLQERGIPYQFIKLEGAPHGMENWEGRPEWLGYKDRLVEWLRSLPSRPPPPRTEPRTPGPGASRPDRRSERE
jgi:acetyl esterase/lipase